LPNPAKKYGGLPIFLLANLENILLTLRLSVTFIWEVVPWGVTVTRGGVSKKLKRKHKRPIVDNVSVDFWNRSLKRMACPLQAPPGMIDLPEHNSANHSLKGLEWILEQFLEA
jgi:hypothetical protein